MSKNDFVRTRVSTVDVRTKTHEILAPIEAANSAAEWTFHGNVRAVVVPPIGGEALVRAYEIGTPRTEAIAHALSKVFAANANGAPKPLVDVFAQIVKETDAYESAINSGFIPAPTAVTAETTVIGSSTSIGAVTLPRVSKPTTKSTASRHG